MRIINIYHDRSHYLKDKIDLYQHLPIQVRAIF